MRLLGFGAQDSAPSAHAVPVRVSPGAPAVPAEVDLVVEVPRLSFVKWGADGGVDFVSPLPCPFNYGSAPAVFGADGDPADVVWLGPRQPRGARARLPVVAVVRFVDRGLRDDKWVCSRRPLGRRDRAALVVFFRAYAWAKRLTGRGPSRFGGIELAQSGGART